MAAAASPVLKHNSRCLPFPFPFEATAPQKFQLKLDDSFLQRTLRKVRDYRPAESLFDDWNNEGPLPQKLVEIAEYWGGSFDWRAVESQINDKYEHYATTVPGNGNYQEPIPLHFVHQRAKDPNATPLLLLHGWPSTFLEWSKVIKPLVEDENRAYHIVAPDLPGFGFSPAPTKPGLGAREMGRAVDALMHQLGYDRYGLVTTDLGWWMGMWMASDVHDSIIGHMTDFFIAPPTAEDRSRMEAKECTAEESSYMAAQAAWGKSHWLYSDGHQQKPLALAAALGDSPVGFLGWYWDVNHATSGGYPYSPEELVTDAMMLYIPGPYANIRFYREFFMGDGSDSFNPMQFPETDVPTGVSEWGWANGPFPDCDDFAFAPESWVKRHVNLAYFSRHPGGGHFPAVSQPQLWVKDVQQFFAGLKADG